MSSDRDPTLTTLFAQAEQSFDNDAFVADVMREIDRQRRKTLIVWFVLALFLLACFAALATPVIAALGMATQLLPVSLVEIQTDWIRQLVSPINSVAAVVALIVLGIMKLYRRVLR